VTPATATEPRAGQPSTARRPGGRPGWLLLGLYLLGLGLSLQLAWSTVKQLHGTKGADFLVIHEAAGAVLGGKQLYDVRRVERDLFGPSYHLPPLGAVVAAPFGLLDEDTALTAWRLLTLAAHFGSLALLLRVLGVPWSSPLAPAALAVWAFCWPARATLIHGQWDALFLLTLSAVWWAERRRRGLLAGALLALAGSVKPYPLLALGYFVGRRRWSALLAALLGLALLLGLAYALGGPRNTLIFLQQVVPHLGATTAYAENQSLAGFLARLIEPEMRPVVAESPTVYLLSRLLFLAGLLAPLGLLGLRAPRGPFGPELQYAAWVAAIPIGIPVAWMHYQHLLLLPFLFLAAAWWSGRGPRPGPAGLALFGLALALVAFGDHYTVLGPAAGDLFKQQTARVDQAGERLLARFSGPAMLLISYKLYGALLLFGLCLQGAWRRSAWQGFGRRGRAAAAAEPSGALGLR
jgi:hypothetical protein